MDVENISERTICDNAIHRIRSHATSPLYDAVTDGYLLYLPFFADSQFVKGQINSVNITKENNIEHALFFP